MPKTRRQRPLRTDLARANWSTLIAIIPSMVTVVLLRILMPTLDPSPVESIAMFYTIYWPLFTVVYLTWTHRAYSTRDIALLRESARNEAKRDRRWRPLLTGANGPTDWTATGAVVAVIVTVAIALSPDLHKYPIFILLGLATVAGSWALMVYSYALDYLRIDLLHDPADTTTPQPLKFEFGDTPGFSDYLMFSLMVSAMAVAAPARIASRQAWRVVGRNVLMAFIFNTVIVAMMVSLLFGGLGS